MKGNQSDLTHQFPTTRHPWLEQKNQGRLGCATSWDDFILSTAPVMLTPKRVTTQGHMTKDYPIRGHPGVN